MTDVRKGDRIVVGRQGLRVFPAETRRPAKPVRVHGQPGVQRKAQGRDRARDRRRHAAAPGTAGEKILAVLGPGRRPHRQRRAHLPADPHGYLNVLFAGNALATHDIEQALFGTSLGVSLDRGLPAEEGHEHHLRAINTIRRLGGIRAAVERGMLKSGIMYECVQARYAVRPGRQHPRRRSAAGSHHRRAGGPAARCGSRFTASASA